jgi:hypothetical protein
MIKFKRIDLLSEDLGSAGPESKANMSDGLLCLDVATQALTAPLDLCLFHINTLAAENPDAEIVQ